jgi:dTDP-4-amino-4,6-dideoxygalactose transaminase
MNKLAIHGGTPVRNEFIVYGSPDIGEDEINEVVDCLRTGWLSTGPKVIRFENDIKNYTGAAHAVATSSCTAALHLSLIVSGIGKGDEVITTPMTFGATINVIEHVGAVPILADITAGTFTIDPDDIEARITPRTKAIIPVHFAGNPCDMDSINRIAEKHGLSVIEDAAHALGTIYRNRMIGDGENLTCFSFYVTKKCCYR